MIPIYKPYLPKSSLSHAHEALDSTWISSQGKFINLAQEKMQELLGVKYVQLLFNGTCACHLVAKALSRKLNKAGKKQLLVPTNVYVAAWNSFLFDAGEYQLISVKTDLASWNIDLADLDAKIQQYPEAAVLIVHNIGNILNVPRLRLQYPNTVFVEDNCEGLLGKYEGAYSGTSAFCSSISFFGNKSITSGEGGAFVTNDEEAYLHAKCIQGQGQSKTRFVHNELGYNYRLTNIQAALLLGQLQVLPEILERKDRVFGAYRSALKDREDVLMQTEAPGTQHSNWMFGVRIPAQKNYEGARVFFEEKGIEVRPMFYSITAHAHLSNSPDILHDEDENADILNRQCIILPSFPELTSEEQGHILRVLDEYLKGI